MHTSKLIKDTPTDRIFLFVLYIFIGLAVLIVLYPLIYIISASVSSPLAVNSGKMWLWPVGFNLDGYKVILQYGDIWRGYMMTIFYTISGTMVSLFITIPCAYAISRRDFAGKKWFTNFMLITMFLSGGLIPTYLLVRNLGMLNTVWAIIIPNAVSVYNIIVTKSFFQSTIPWEMQEAAKVDGASDFQIFFRIVLPLSAPIIAVMALFYGVGQWNDYFNSLVYLQNKNLYPLQMVLRQILVLQDMQQGSATGSTISQSAAQAAFSKEQLVAVIKYGVMIVSSLPVIMVYPLLQRYFVKGVLIGSLKG
ncbi:ABC transporter permease subunit [Schleiferilactobacillus harbinensis]|jgi:putative aldouronate transport system permease protein|uniref:Abc-type sugar transport system, permease component n=1 Tax=Schleiferilactobacillus harbinensis DSM 16991 TaxID=1122147 RepID=A0A0R1X9T6_9LACO|nr:carbohydrate ABC transporter permease [Schleiferilactobacillus harbinensis]KRM26936.1 abc-type sugar transport system, permease component [Schleiferilactobacillus harbinensis DSM 16991]QEU47778.1 carbohydrate ABC transporter permease [Schleiferilactobacillus harbinensis]QFR63258.1 ABC transporter permease subunit [Schleiferilactobacillus harbinensis]